MTGMTAFFQFVDSVNWRPWMEFFTFLGIVLITFQMQYTERFDDATRSHHGIWDRLRRVSYLLKMLALIWCATYGFYRDLWPWPPVVAMIAAVDLYIFVQIMILRFDTRRYGLTDPGLR